MKKFFLIFSLITLIFTFSIPCYANEGDISVISSDIPDFVVDKAKELNLDFFAIVRFGDNYELYAIDGYENDNFFVLDFSLPTNDLPEFTVTFESNSSMALLCLGYFSNGEWIVDYPYEPSFEYTFSMYHDDGVTPRVFDEYRLFINNEQVYPEVVDPVPPETDLSFEDNVISLLQKNNELLTHIYTAQLFAIAVVVVVGVVFLLYKFLKSFY